MAITAVIGAQWGDEGKGKFVDSLAQTADLVVRFNGGNNAGHTIVNEYGTFKLHLIPCGAFNPQALCIIGPGVVVDLADLLQEIEAMEAAGVSLRSRLRISPRSHLIMPYHRTLDRLYEEAKGKLSTGTTGRGIGPVYADKASYNGLRLADLARPALFREKLDCQIGIKNRLISALGGQPLDAVLVAEEYFGYYSRIASCVAETFGDVQAAIRDGKDILLEGAQAALLDTDWGAYPFVTAGTTLVSAACAGAGVPFKAIDRIIGVCKAYITRVGNGPMPTELNDTMGEHLRQVGQEFGATTGRPRRCGWFDAEMLRFTATLSSFTELALTKLDVLDDVAQIKVATSYEYQGRPAHYYDGDATWLAECTPVYETLPGWQTSISAARTFEELPSAAQNYVAYLEEVAGVKASFIGVGPSREQTIVR